MDALTSARFIIGVLVGIGLYHVWLMRMAKKNG